MDLKICSMLTKYSGNTENHRRCNGARPKAAREESKKSDLKKFRTRERFDEIFRVAVVGDTVRLDWWLP